MLDAPLYLYEDPKSQLLPGAQLVALVGSDAEYRIDPLTGTIIRGAVNQGESQLKSR